jgi:pimeloyl-ACP methyl ester carboxylesterase
MLCMKCAEGSGVSFGRCLVGAAGAFLLFAAVPGAADALRVSLSWGGDPDAVAEVDIEDGGTYSVPLNTGASARLALDQLGPYFGSIYELSPDDPSRRVLIASNITTVAGNTSFAWPEAGTYELDIFGLGAPPCCIQALAHDPLHDIASLFVNIVEAQSPPPLSQVAKITFTIKDKDAAVCTERCYSNVMFLPGIEASRLYDTDNGETRLWEPGSLTRSGDADAMQLAMNPDGTSVRSDIYTRDILDNAYVPVKGNVYRSFIDDMDALKNDGTINDWEPMPYDWRLPLDQILASGKVIDDKGDISYLDATDTPYIIQELYRLAATSKSGKVTIIAHSNGGLLAKALMQKIGDAETSRLIDKVILVASPQVGTPQAIAGLLHGNGLALPAEQFPQALSDATGRAVGDTFPGIYNLLPSVSYFTYVDDPVVAFDASTSDMAIQYGDAIHSADRLVPFLADPDRQQPSVNDLDDPTSLNASFVNEAEQTHQSLDSWTPPTGVKVIQIAGWGQTTVLGVGYTRIMENGVTKLEPEPQFTVDGDNTVVVPSALWISQAMDSQDFWVNLKKYNDDHYLSTLGGSGGKIPYTHIGILQVSPVLSFLNDEITENVEPLSNYGYITDSAPASTDTRLRYALHSPLTLDLYDEQGNHTGVSTTTGEIEDNVPGTYYVQYGDVKYIFADTGIPQHIVMSGYDTGTFTFEVGELQGDNTIASTTFADIPVTPQTKVTFDVVSGFDSASNLVVDEKGDGSDMSTYASSTGEIIVPVTETSEPVVSSASGGGNGPPVTPATGKLVGTTSVVTAIASSTTPFAETMVAMIAASTTVSTATTSVPVHQVLYTYRGTQRTASTTASVTRGQHTVTTDRLVAGAATSQGIHIGLFDWLYTWIWTSLRSLHL